MRTDSNTYGPGIISAARIISKDRLNRFLIDENTHLWFLKNLHGIEGLIRLKISDYYKKLSFIDDELKLSKEHFKTLLYNQSIFSCDIQQLDIISVKKDELTLSKILCKQT
jgi:hypothetical protein